MSQSRPHRPVVQAQIHRIVTVLARHHPHIVPWSVERVDEGLNLQWTDDGKAWHARIEPKHDGASFGQSASCSVSIRSDESIPRLPSTVESFLQVFMTLLQRTDTGDWTFPALVSPRRSRTEWAGRESDSAIEAHEDLAESLHYASYVAYRAVTSTDLYPHINPLGDPVDGETLRESWAQTLAVRRAGKGAPKLGLYVHVPYCTVACTFCYCGKTDKFTRGDFETYLSRLEEEIAFFAPVFEGASFTSVYFGGGTPSLLSPPALKRLFGLLYGAFDVADAEQIIFEGNPDSLNPRKIEILATEGKVTRLTVGVQTLDDEAQRRSRRFNTHHHVSEAVAAARQFGIPHINIDLMAGMDGQSVSSFQEDVHFVLSLQPDSMNLNGFRPVPRTAWYEAGNVMTQAQMDDREVMLQWGFEQLSSSGLVSQRAVDPGRTRHAANIQEYNLRRQNSSLLGLGFPARSHAFGQWFYEPNVAGGFDPALARHNQGQGAWTGVPVDAKEEAHKFLVDNLVTGFDLREYRALFDGDPWETAGEGLTKLSRLGVIRRDGDWVETDAGIHVDVLIYRVLLYGPSVWARVQQRWGPEYDPQVDYRGRLDRLIARKG